MLSFVDCEFISNLLKTKNRPPSLLFVFTRRTLVTVLTEHFYIPVNINLYEDSVQLKRVA